ncbi:hypothetical protein [Paratractidigestivibacter sp.]|uniref:hypothetical protein n=1 Tax=Paratractidigestivibacter sp. TaxID=2847316 RepID=UPI002ABDDF47|nr:hypothetical protein [Paratractidigestivibacter sp.]
MHINHRNAHSPNPFVVLDCSSIIAPPSACASSRWYHLGKKSLEVAHWLCHFASRWHPEYHLEASAVPSLRRICQGGAD